MYGTKQANSASTETSYRTEYTLEPNQIKKTDRTQLTLRLSFPKVEHRGRRHASLERSLALQLVLKTVEVAVLYVQAAESADKTKIVGQLVTSMIG